MSSQLHTFNIPAVHFFPLYKMWNEINGLCNGRKAHAEAMTMNLTLLNNCYFSRQPFSKV